MESSSPAPQVIQPMGIGGVLDPGLALARRNYSVLVRTTAYAVVPAYVLGVIVALLVGSPSNPTNTATPDVLGVIVALHVGSASASAIIRAIILFIGTVFAGLALVIACAHAIAPTSQLNELQAGALYSVAWSRVSRVILFVIMAIILAIPLVILFPLGIYLGVRWAMAWNALVIEGLGPIAALRRSWSLTRSSWWDTLGVGIFAAILVGLVSFVVVFIFALIGGVVIATGGEAVGTIITNLGFAVGTIFVVPFGVAIGVVLFYELRACSEGLDLVTPSEHTPGSYRLATVGERLLESLIDVGLFIFIYGIASVLLALGVGSLGGLGELWAIIAFLVGGLLVFGLFSYVLYYIYLWDKGQTPGKRMLGITVVDANTLRPARIGKMAVRQIVGYPVSGLVLFLGFLWIIWDKEHQGWHDKLANTLVIKPLAAESVSRISAV